MGSVKSEALVRAARVQANELAELEAERLVLDEKIFRKYPEFGKNLAEATVLEQVVLYARSLGWLVKSVVGNDSTTLEFELDDPHCIVGQKQPVTYTLTIRDDFTELQFTGPGLDSVHPDCRLAWLARRLEDKGRALLRERVAFTMEAILGRFVSLMNDEG